MFPLLSQLPQLSPKRGSQSTCLLIHLKRSNNRTPQFPSIYLSLALALSLHFFHLFFFILTFPYLHSIHSNLVCFFFSVCTNLSAFHPHVFPPKPCLTSQLYAGFPSSPSSPCYPSLSPVPCCRAQGEEKRRV